MKRGIKQLWRGAAGVMLVMAACAFGLCALHCSTGFQLFCSGNVSKCHGTATEEGEPAQEQESGQGVKLTCETFESGFWRVPEAKDSAKTFLVITVPHALFAPADNNDEQAALILRQTKTPERAGTPEVYLGAALRSQAPPILLQVNRG